MTDWYAEARKFQFNPEFVRAGIVSQEQADQASAMWVDYLERAHVLTEDMPDEVKDRVAGKQRSFHTVGGVRVINARTDTLKMFQQIDSWIDGIARRNADIQREQMGWTLNKRGWHLVDPDGNEKPPRGNGQPYGPYTTPSRFRDLGEWDGTITDETKFTK